MLDTDLQQLVLDELRDEPSVDAAQIGVAAKGGVVSLTGHVPTFAQKRAAEEAAKRVYGVQAVADDLEVRLPTADQRTDSEIAQAALDALRWNALFPKDQIKVTVDRGWVRLEGTVHWRYQSEAAANAVFPLRGVRGLVNGIEVQTKLSSGDVKGKIFEVFRRNAELEARRIGIAVHDGRVALHGNVHDWSEVRAALRAAWSVPGVNEVENKLAVVP
jgi:osmotically-inducible protein OsmY